MFPSFFNGAKTLCKEEGTGGISIPFNFFFFSLGLCSLGGIFINFILTS